MKIILVISLISTIISTVDFDLEQVRKDLLDRHNYYRAIKPRFDPLPKPELPISPQPLPFPVYLQASAPSKGKNKHKLLTRSPALEKIAQSHSEKLVSLGYLVHSSNTLNGNHIGENLYIWNKGGFLGTKSSR